MPKSTNILFEEILRRSESNNSVRLSTLQKLLLDAMMTDRTVRVVIEDLTSAVPTVSLRKTVGKTPTEEKD
jgi:hypothetical protein